MRFQTFAGIALTIALLGCSKPEAPEPKAPPAAAPAAKPAAPPPVAAAPKPQQQPLNPMPTIVVHPPADAPPDPRRTQTPCDRKEAGWKWQGTVVEDGHCSVGPCVCVQG